MCKRVEDGEKMMKRVRVSGYIHLICINQKNSISLHFNRKDGCNGYEAWKYESENDS